MAEKVRQDRICSDFRRESLAMARELQLIWRPSTLSKTEFPLFWNYSVDAADGCKKIGRKSSIVMEYSSPLCLARDTVAKSNIGDSRIRLGAEKELQARATICEFIYGLLFVLFRFYSAIFANQQYEWE